MYKNTLNILKILISLMEYYWSIFGVLVTAFSVKSVFLLSQLAPELSSRGR